MSISVVFAAPSFTLTSAQTVDASTIVATFDYHPNIGSGVYSLVSNHGAVRTVLQGAGPTPYQLYLYTNAPLTQDFWTLTYSGQTTGSPPVAIVPGTAYFWSGVGLAPVGIAAPPFSGANGSAYDFLRDNIPSSMKGNAWACFIAGLAVGEQVAWDNAPLVDRQMFLATASGVWLDRRAAGMGMERPVDVGMLDDDFRDYTVSLSSGQQTLIAFLEALRGRVDAGGRLLRHQSCGGAVHRHAAGGGLGRSRSRTGGRGRLHGRGRGSGSSGGRLVSTAAAGDERENDQHSQRRDRQSDEDRPPSRPPALLPWS